MIDFKRWDYLIEVCKKAGSFPIRKKPKDNEELEKMISTALDLGDIYLKFKAKRNPVYLMEAFNRATDDFFDVPEWVRTELYRAFGAYILADGETSIDTLLKVSGRGFRGSPFKRIASEESERNIAHQVTTLRSAGFTLKVACSLVAFKSSTNGPVSLSESRVEEIYKHFRGIEEGQEWFGILWGDEIKSPGLVVNFMIDYGFLLDSDCKQWPPDGDQKKMKSYWKVREKLVCAYLESI
jgi:hypothetical protein